MRSRAGSGNGVSPASREASTCPCGQISGRSRAAAKSSRAIDRWVGSEGKSRSSRGTGGGLLKGQIQQVGAAYRSAAREGGVARQPDQQRGGAVALGGGTAELVRCAVVTVRSEQHVKHPLVRAAVALAGVAGDLDAVRLLPERPAIGRATCREKTQNDAGAVARSKNETD